MMINKTNFRSNCYLGIVHEQFVTSYKQQVIRDIMNKIQSLSRYTYLFLIIANFIYLYAFGFKPIIYHPKLILYNLLFFSILSLAIILKASYLLNQWFVKDQGQQKANTKRKLKQFLDSVNKVLNWLTPGNQHNLIYIYLAFAGWQFLASLIPSFLLGIYFAIVNQLRSYIQANYQSELSHYGNIFWAFVESKMEMVPRYRQNRVSH